MDEARKSAREAAREAALERLGSAVPADDIIDAYEAALKYFGLVDYQGGGADRVAVMTEDARTFLRAQQESVKKDVLRRIALKPKAIAMKWEG